jgi:hypothetical protein
VALRIEVRPRIHQECSTALSATSLVKTAALLYMAQNHDLMKEPLGKRMNCLQKGQNKRFCAIVYVHGSSVKVQVVSNLQRVLPATVG